MVVDAEEQQPVHPCRAALMKDVKRITDSLFDSLSSSSSNDAARRSSDSSAVGGSSALLFQSPAAYLRALRPLLLALLSQEAGQQRVATWWRASGLAQKEDLGLAGNGEEWRNEDILGALRALVTQGLITSKDPALASSSSSSFSSSMKQKEGQKKGREEKEEQEQTFLIEGNGGGPSKVKKRWSGRPILPELGGGGGGSGGSNKRSKAV